MATPHFLQPVATKPPKHGPQTKRRLLIAIAALLVLYLALTAAKALTTRKPTASDTKPQTAAVLPAVQTTTVRNGLPRGWPHTKAGAAAFLTAMPSVIASTNDPQKNASNCASYGPPGRTETLEQCKKLAILTLSKPVENYQAMTMTTWLDNPFMVNQNTAAANIYSCTLTRTDQRFGTSTTELRCWLDSITAQWDEEWRLISWNRKAANPRTATGPTLTNADADSIFQMMPPGRILSTPAPTSIPTS